LPVIALFKFIKNQFSSPVSFLAIRQFYEIYRQLQADIPALSG